MKFSQFTCWDHVSYQILTGLVHTRGLLKTPWNCFQGAIHRIFFYRAVTCTYLLYSLALNRPFCHHYCNNSYLINLCRSFESWKIVLHGWSWMQLPLHWALLALPLFFSCTISLFSAHFAFSGTLRSLNGLMLNHFQMQRLDERQTLQFQKKV